jgi:hypothetical protein
MTPSQARQISYDGHSATEPERGNKKLKGGEISYIRDFRLD